MPLSAIGAALVPSASSVLKGALQSSTGPAISSSRSDPQRIGGAPITVAPVGLNVGEILQSYTTGTPENGGFGLTPSFMGGNAVGVGAEGLTVRKAGFPIAMVALIGVGIAAFIILRRRRS